MSSVRENTLKQIVHLQQEVLGDARIFASDVDRFRRRPQGPHGHPLLVKSERLPRTLVDRRWCTLEDMSVTPDGKRCLLWRIDGHPLHGLQAQIADRTWLLKFEEVAICDGGCIIGFNRRGKPIIEMHWTPTHEAGAPCSMIYIGDEPLKRSLSQATQRNRQAWTMGADKRLWCMEKNPDDPVRPFLIGYSAETGMVDYCCPLHLDIGNVVDSLAVKNCMNYALVTYDDREKSPWRVLVTDNKAESGGRLPDSKVALADREIWLFSMFPNDLQRWVQLPCDTADGVRGKGRYPYRGGLTKIDGEYAYIGEMAHKQVGWIIGEHACQGFRRVTNLFHKDDKWYYWAEAEDHLFLMELPLPDGTR